MPAAPDSLSILPIGGAQNPFAPSAYVLARALGVATAEDITVPTGGAYVRLAGTGDFYYSTTTTATVPGDTTDGTACELVKVIGPAEWRYVAGVTAISVISPGACVLTASFWLG